MSHTSAGCWVDNYIQVVDTHGVEVWHVFMRLKNIEGWFMDTLIQEIGHWLKFVTVEVSFTVWSFFFYYWYIYYYWWLHCFGITFTIFVFWMILKFQNLIKDTKNTQNRDTHIGFHIYLFENKYPALWLDSSSYFSHRTKRLQITWQMKEKIVFSDHYNVTMCENVTNLIYNKHITMNYTRLWPLLL